MKIRVCYTVTLTDEQYKKLVKAARNSGYSPGERRTKQEAVRCLLRDGGQDRMYRVINGEEEV